MPSSLLFATNNEGRVYALSTGGSAWREFLYLGLEFKKVSAVPHFLWAIGGDRQVYVHVHGLDIPIRCPEVAYENERWLPLDGFSGRMLPTDRPHFSSMDGLQARSIDKIRLPSMAWQWEGDWQLDCTLDGQPLDHDGWSYAVDFPTRYQPEKKWNSCVRRRKWVRYRRYSALNSWCAVAPLHKDPTEEPFIDVAIGGTAAVPATGAAAAAAGRSGTASTTEQSAGSQLMVWAITAHGRVMWRSGCSTVAPEGLRWTAVSTPAGTEVSQVSVGAAGLVWAVLYSGRVLVRSAVTYEQPMGESWLEVKPPTSSNGSGAVLKIVQVSVGMNAVWCVTSDSRVWFRRGVQGEAAGRSEDAAIGSGWVEMVGNISSVSVAANDQVFAIGSDDRALYFRAGVTASDLTGKKWRPVRCPMQMSRTSSQMSMASSTTTRRSGSASPAGAGLKHHSLGSLYRERGRVEKSAIIEHNVVNEETSRSAPAPNARAKLELWQKPASPTSPLAGGNAPQQQHQAAMLASQASTMSLSSSSSSATMAATATTAPGAGSLNEKALLRQKMHSLELQHLQQQQAATSAPTYDIFEHGSRHLQHNQQQHHPFETPLKNPRAWSPVRSVGSMVGTEAHPESDAAVFDAADSSSRDSGVFGGGGGYDDDDHTGSQSWADCEQIWTNCSAGAVTVDVGGVAGQLPLWFSDAGASSAAAAPELTQSWRLSILARLKARISPERIEGGLERYEQAVEKSSWVKSGEMKAAKPFEPLEEAIVELEWVSSSMGGGGFGTTMTTYSDSGTLTVLAPDGVTTRMQFSLAEIRCVMACSEPGSPRLSIHVPMLPCGSSPLRLQFSGDTDLEDWLSHLTSVCCQINGVRDRPSADSVWLTTGLGDVMVYDRSNDKAEQLVKRVADERSTTDRTPPQLYRQDIDVSTGETPYSHALVNGMRVGSALRIRGCVYDDADQIRFDLQCHAEVATGRQRVEKRRKVALHVNPRFSERTVVLNMMVDSEWQTETRTPSVAPFAAGAEFDLLVCTEPTGFRVSVNGVELCLFRHRCAPQEVCSVFVSGRVKLFGVVYCSPTVIVPLMDVFWRQMGGHLRRVETCGEGVTWGIGYDNTAWVYTGGWGGDFMRGLESGGQAGGLVQPMSDTQNYYIYENQRWNPLSGYTAHGLPTDRHMWSDVTGKHKRSKEHTKVLSVHWQWISDWLVDFHTPGGVDRDGWQYALDFPAKYHGKKQFSDYVRRRRWYRKCRLSTSGPWHELGNSKICDVALQPLDWDAGDNLHLVGRRRQSAVEVVDDDGAENAIDAGDADDAAECGRPISVWAIAGNGDALWRRGVTAATPGGQSWEHVASHQPLVSIACAPGNRVWVVSKSGTAFVRCGVSGDNPQGDAWQPVEPPAGTTFRAIRAGRMGVWALDALGRLVVRREVTQACPEGRHWTVLANVPGDGPHTEAADQCGFKAVSVGVAEVWAIANSGQVCRRCGISSDNPVGTGWSLGIPGNFQHVSVNGLE